MNLNDLELKIFSRWILTSRGIPTVEVDIITKYGTTRASVPSGKSTGKKEALELLDGGVPFYGKGVEKALANVTRIAEVLNENRELKFELLAIDNLLHSIDKSKNWNVLGANAVLPISICFCRIAALAEKVSDWQFISKISEQKSSIPLPNFNVINGGEHSGNKLVFQEIMVCFAGDDIKDNLRDASMFYHDLKKTISFVYGDIATSVGDEGGFAPPIDTLEEALNLIVETYK
ncbi:MAG: phosphopyruvate hydratase, partial [Oscillospiraceae bacterium]